MSGIEDSETFKVGKETEAYIIAKLRDIGYTVTDISMEQLENSKGVLYYSHFDIYAEFKIGRRSYSFLADVKMRTRGRANFWIEQWKVKEYIDYNKMTADDKIVIFVTPKRPDCYMSVDDIQACYTLGPWYFIERHQTDTVVGLRKKLESTYTEYLTDD